MTKFLNLFVICSLFFLSSCGVSQAQGDSIKATPNPMEISTVQPEGQISSTTNQTVVEEQISLTEYTINVSMNYAEKLLDAEQEIKFTNHSKDKIGDILLAVQPNRISGVFSLSEIKVNGILQEKYSLDGQRLDINLDNSLKPKQSVQLNLKFHLALPAIQQGDPNIVRPKIFGVTERQVNLTDWYPMIVPYQPGIGWQLSDPWAYGEHLVYPLANFKINLRFIDAANTPIVAASTIAQPTQGGMKYIFKNARDFTMVMSRHLHVLSNEVDGVTVFSYFYPGSEAGGKAVLETSSKAIKTFVDLYGPYPHKSLSAVQGDFEDGMEFDGLYYLSNSFYKLYDGTNENYLTMVAAHETSHQWWFGKVASDQANQPWLDESLATYSEYIFYEKNFPESLNWWWANRIDYYKPEGKIDEAVPSYGGFTPYTNATYRRGAQFLNDLRQAIGDEAFFSFLREYATQMDGRIANSSDFFEILGRTNSENLRGLFSEYFSKPPS